ncbi:MAG TPA: tyrosine-type recombinase/integrase [Pirellulales bacterium]|nr:tyrosine-type recombinase/integrase [Pirellulales bacterium]
MDDSKIPKQEILPPSPAGMLPSSPGAAGVPDIIRFAGPDAAQAFDEFFAARIRNRYTRAAYLHAVRRFMAWAVRRCNSIEDITPGMIGNYFDEHPGAVPTRKLHLSAIRSFFDVLVKHGVVKKVNPAASVRGERYEVKEGKTPEISRDQARKLLASILTDTAVGRRDAALIATLIYTAARAGAVAGLRMKHLQWDGKQYTLRFLEKGGKSRLIPVQLKLHGYLLEYLDSLDWKALPADSPLFRSAAGRTGLLTDRPMRNIDVCRMVKRRLKAAGLPDQFSPHSFRVATLTDLLIQGVSLEDAAYLAGHADTRTTRLYDRRKQEVTRGTVEKISI